MSEERLQKILARAGYGSRRSCELIVTAGRVKVNGEVKHLGDKADMAVDTITVDGQVLPKVTQMVYLALNKPRMALSDVGSEDPRPNVRDLVPSDPPLFPVGRLDFESEGLMLMTNDGDLANRLTHPRYEHEKEYRVLVAARPDDEQMSTWRRGVVLEDGYKTAPAQVEFETAMGKGAWLRVIMHEGRKRQIREIGSRIGLPVVRIVRIRIGTLRLGTLKPREWRVLTEKEIDELKHGPRQESKSRAPKATAKEGAVVPSRKTERMTRKAPFKPGASKPGSARETHPATRRTTRTKKD